MFGKKKEKEECIRICLNGVEIYRGTMTDLPLKEEIILGKAMSFLTIPIPVLSTAARSASGFWRSWRRRKSRKTGSFGTGMQPFREWIR